MADAAAAAPQAATTKASLSGRERRALRTSAATLFLHDPSIDSLDALAEHPALREGLALCPPHSLQRWALEDDWHGARRRHGETVRHHLQSVVGDMHLQRQRAHIEQMTDIYNSAGKRLAGLKPKSYESMMQLRIRALELVHGWEKELMRGNQDSIPSDQPSDDADGRQTTVIDRMSDAEVRNLFAGALQSGKT